MVGAGSTLCIRGKRFLRNYLDLQRTPNNGLYPLSPKTKGLTAVLLGTLEVQVELNNHVCYGLWDLVSLGPNS